MRSTFPALLAALALTCAPAAAIAQDKPTDHSQDSAWMNAQMAALASRQAKDGWGWLPGGVLWRRVAGSGTGRHPTVADTVKVHYAGTLVDGTEFDSSYGGDPVSFPLRGLIRAWQEAIPQAGVGDTIEIAVPSSLGYGPKGAGPIPGGATLLFKIELLGIES
jgi:FKBP-type peptidyl-prolyl cis-trans isomerase